MRRSVVLAVFVSLVLIGSASWSRFFPKEEVKPSLELANAGSGELTTKEELAQILSNKAPSNEESKEPVSTTEVLSRQLMSEYISLASTNSLNSETFENLVDKYVSTIPELIKYPKVSYFDLYIISNSKENLQKYAAEITAIHKTYAQEAGRSLSGKNLDTLGEEFYSSLEKLGEAYESAATKLKNMGVPAELSQAHLDLINSYLSSAYAAKAISKTEYDSASAFAGLNSFNQSLLEEQVARREITRILNSNGI